MQNYEPPPFRPDGAPMFAYYAYITAGFLCPWLPVRFGYWLFARLGDLLYFLTARRQKTYFVNLRHVLGNQAPQVQVDAVARRAFQNLLKNYFDLFRGHAMTHERIRAQLAGVEGLDYLKDALKQGKGVIAGSAHFGTWDMILHLAAIFLDARIVIPNERLKPEKLNQYVLAQRSSQGIDVVPIDTAPRLLIKALRSGQIAGLAFDRDITRTGPHVDFFGQSAQMPDGAVQLALKYGAPVVIGFSIRLPDNRSQVYIEPPLQFEKTGDNQRDICAGVEKMTTIMEKYIRQYPDQWLMFQKIWDDDGVKKG